MANEWKHIAELWQIAFGQQIRLARLENKENNMSEQFDAIKASVQSLVTEDGYLLQQFADLKAKLANGEYVTTADLNELQAALTGEVDRVHTAVAVADPEDPTGGTDDGTVSADPDPVATTPVEPIDDGGSVIVNDPADGTDTSGAEVPTAETPVFGSGGIGPSA